jgi:hypothetical protein
MESRSQETWLRMAYHHEGRPLHFDCEVTWINVMEIEDQYLGWQDFRTTLHFISFCEVLWKRWPTRAKYRLEWNSCNELWILLFKYKNTRNSAAGSRLLFELRMYIIKFYSFIQQWLYSPLLGPGPFFNFLISFRKTVGHLGQVISPLQTS